MEELEREFKIFHSLTYEQTKKLFNHVQEQSERIAALESYIRTINKFRVGDRPDVKRVLKALSIRPRANF